MELADALVQPLKSAAFRFSISSPWRAQRTSTSRSTTSRKSRTRLHTSVTSSAWHMCSEFLLVTYVIHRPSGKYVMEDLHRVGGIPALLKYLLKHTDLIDGTQMTVTGKTLAENLEDVAELEFENQDVVRPLSNPLKGTGHLTILRGNLAPETAVAKITGKEGLRVEVRHRAGSLLDTRLLITTAQFRVSRSASTRE